MSRQILVFLMVSFLSAEQIISTEKYSIITPFSSKGVNCSYQMEVKNGVTSLVKRYVYEDDIVLLSGDSISINGVSFLIESDTFVAGKDTLIVIPKTVVRDSVPQILHRTELVSSELYLDIYNYINSNTLAKSAELMSVLNRFFKDKQWYFFFEGTIAEQIHSGLSGPPMKVEQVDSTIYRTESFRSGSAMEKVALFTDKSAKTMAISLVCFFDSPQRESASRPEKKFVTFYSTSNAQRELERFVQEWHDEK